MIRAAVIFLALVVSAGADVAVPRYLDATRLIENWQGRDGRHGERGPYQITRAVWDQHMKPQSSSDALSLSKGFALAREERWGRECARRHVVWLQRQLQAAGIDPSAFNVALAYNAGLETVLRSRVPERAYQHAGRVRNLYQSPPTP